VISVDTCVANLGAMIGKPTAVLLNQSGEWRPVIDSALDWLSR
jgi:hypothetical protein